MPRVLLALAVVTTAAIESGSADPPRSKPDAGLIWLLNTKSGNLVGLRPDGTKGREVELELWNGHRFLGLTADGKQVLYAAKAGRQPEEDIGGLTLHVRPLDDPAKWVDTTIEVQRGSGSASVVVSPDGRRVARNRAADPDKPALGGFGTEADVFELATGKKLDVRLPSYSEARGWSADGRSVLVRWTDSGPTPPMTLAKTRLLKVPVGGGGLAVLAEDAPYDGFALSPDGKSVLGAGYRPLMKEESAPVYGLAVLDLGTRAWKPVAFPADQTVATGAWSPDGNRVVTFGRFGRPQPPVGLPKITRVAVTVSDPDGKNAKTIYERTDADELSFLSFVGWTAGG